MNVRSPEATLHDPCATAALATPSHPIPPGALVVTVGDRELVIRRRYETLSIVNDILIALWFIVGSVLFLSTETANVGTWLFIAGSVELLIRPAIRLTRNLHLQRLPGRRGTPPEATQDF
jgi:hypothetical protein